MIESFMTWQQNMRIVIAYENIVSIIWSIKL